jgi:rhodanese-related sulfurtransferase
MKRFKLLRAAGLIVVVLLAFASAHAGNPNYRSPEQVDGAETISADRARELFDEGVKFIDVRSPRLHNRRHIPGAHHLDLKNAYDEQSLAAVADRDEPIVIYCSGVKCSRSYRASEQAVSWGYSKIHYFRGGIADWRDAGYPVVTSEQQ